MSYADTSNPNSPVSMVEKWDKTFAESDKVDHRKVAFQNRYGIILVGDLYIPKNRGERKLAAIALSGPWCGQRAIKRPVCTDPGRTGICCAGIRSFLHG